MLDSSLDLIVRKSLEKRGGEFEGNLLILSCVLLSPADKTSIVL